VAEALTRDEARRIAINIVPAAEPAGRAVAGMNAEDLDEARGLLPPAVEMARD
jgi:hypothetical protein